ncbi:MAG: ATP-binding cassette domain-containing protein [Nevskiaceae bacterium]|nr:MAG: ATP-binding cassette domain-containing protein [Nevskiaceae bacterium]TBR72030.1 MAG: ATP-binding cassette domain-containing protein [Nevskiaceae bacterium]
MIIASDLTLRRGGNALLQHASFQINDGWKVGVVGRNGTGKSTLFAALEGALAPDAGTLSAVDGYEVATVAQAMPNSDRSALDFTLDGDAEWRSLQTRLAAAEMQADAAAIAACHERLAQIDGYAAHARAARLLKGLAFSEQRQNAPVNSLSGGWRMRLNLAQALMCRSTLMLLDEPTNHLDLDAVLWLEDFLKLYPGTLLVVSHDRDFLDAVTDHTLHLVDGTTTLYTGNYSRFERLRAERLAAQQSQHAAQQRQVAHLEAFITRFRAKATKARQAQSRIRTLERMEMVSAVHAESPFSFSFPEPERLPSTLLRLDGVTAGYPDTPILKKLKLSILPTHRIGILGANGAGKSTLVKTIAGTLPAVVGNITRDPYLRIGYFAQSTSQALDADASPLLHLRRMDAAAPEQKLRDFLGSFNFRGDKALESVGKFSGGERARLALALVAWQKPNLLLLDEPTNHLDMDMRHALEVALLDYAGAVILVSHDRHLLDSICETLWWVHAGDCAPFDGDVDDYAHTLTGAASHTQAAGAPTHQPAPQAADARRDRAELRRQTKPLRDALKTLDTRMDRLRRKLVELDAQLANPKLYEDAFTAARLAQEHGELKAQLEADEERWLEVGEQLETLATAG